MSIKNLIIILCLLTSSFNQANAVHSSTESISIKESNLQKRTLKERLLDAWVAKRLKKLDTNISLPPDLKKCLTIKLKNRRVHKGYQVQITDSKVAFKKCNSDSAEIKAINLDEIESVTSTDGQEVYFKQPIQKIKTLLTSNSNEEAKIHPAITTGLVLTLGGLGIALWIQLIFGMIMVMSGVLLALTAKKLVKNSKIWKGKSLIRLISGLGVGMLIFIMSLTGKFK